METANATLKSPRRSRSVSTKSQDPSPNASSLARHQRLCTICQHLDREDIEDEILRWRPVENIRRNYNLSNRSVIYRHARALNLFEQRKQTLKPALERVIESVYDAKPSMSASLKAMAIYARLNGDLTFADPPKRVIITHGTEKSFAESAPNVFASSAHDFTGTETPENPAENAKARNAAQPSHEAVPKNDPGACQVPAPVIQVSEPVSPSRPKPPVPEAGQYRDVRDLYHIVTRLAVLTFAFLLGWFLSPGPSHLAASAFSSPAPLSSVSGALHLLPAVTSHHQLPFSIRNTRSQSTKRNSRGINQDRISNRHKNALFNGPAPATSHYVLATYVSYFRAGSGVLRFGQANPSETKVTGLHHTSGMAVRCLLAGKT